VRDGVRALGLQVRAGLHTGKMEHGAVGEMRGIAVHTGARVAGLAAPVKSSSPVPSVTWSPARPSGWKAAATIRSKASPAAGKSSQSSAENT
jgi:hypothetical protein